MANLTFDRCHLPGSSHHRLDWLAGVGHYLPAVGNLRIIMSGVGKPGQKRQRAEDASSSSMVVGDGAGAAGASSSSATANLKTRLIKLLETQRKGMLQRDMEEMLGTYHLWYNCFLNIVLGCRRVLQRRVLDHGARRILWRGFERHHSASRSSPHQQLRSGFFSVADLSSEDLLPALQQLLNEKRLQMYNQAGKDGKQEISWKIISAESAARLQVRRRRLAAGPTGLE